MDIREQLESASSELLLSIARRASSREGAKLHRWEVHPLVANSHLGFVTGGLYRLSGAVKDQGEEFDWSAVLKVLQAPSPEERSPDYDDPSHYNYWRREAEAFSSGVLHDLPAGMTAPAFYGLVERPEDVIWLFMEEIREPSVEWSLDRYGEVARILGAFNGSYLTGRTLPDVPWLVEGMERQWVTAISEFFISTRLVEIRDSAMWSEPPLNTFFPEGHIRPLLDVWEQRESFLTALGTLPHILCHHDAHRPNLFLISDHAAVRRVVGIDWQFVGVGAPGAEIGMLLTGSVFFFKLPATDAARLDHLLFTSYLRGLREVGWQGEEEEVRFAYLTTAILRMSVVGAVWLAIARDPERSGRIDAIFGRSIPEFMDQVGRMTAFACGLAVELASLSRT